MDGSAVLITTNFLRVLYSLRDSKKEKDKIIY